LLRKQIMPLKITAQELHRATEKKRKAQESMRR
jgi:hypothetical protein